MGRLWGFRKQEELLLEDGKTNVGLAGFIMEEAEYRRGLFRKIPKKAL